ncbi:GNAT family N-acetyltransferase [Actinotalea sp. C106]|uniref:GNAT family N-acetyltransferase n=1 Tax=Actinotalea sp. C106 TaxID=2908644 RepID=UPI0020286E65|nr:GNAT family N-acetyltransferase [Actinotalea sp. C106]
MTVDAAPPVIRPAGPADRDDWGELFREYAAGGDITLRDEKLDVVWSWVLDGEAQTRCLLAHSGGRPRGFVHYRRFERPITASAGLWIDDLYVAPATRGQGLAGALIDAVRAEARRDGHDVVRWTTRETNEDAQRLYDRVAVRAPVIVYSTTP